MVSKITPDKLKNPPSSETSWREKNIPFLGGRPDREQVIGFDDILNLIIACNTCSTFEELFRLI